MSCSFREWNYVSWSAALHNLTSTLLFYSMHRDRCSVYLHSYLATKQQSTAATELLYIRPISSSLANDLPFAYR